MMSGLLHSRENIFEIKGLGTEEIVLNRSWLFNPGDEEAWSQPNFDDGDWQPVDSFCAK